MRKQRLAIMIMAVGLAGCARACEACGAQVIEGADLEPLPDQPIGPKGIPPLVPLDPSRISRNGKGLLTKGGCEDTAVPAEERDHAAYERGLGGSARKLRGRVAVLDLRIASPSHEPWTKHLLTSADDVALGARAFLLEQAAARGIHDLSLDIVPWFVTATLPELKIQVDTRARVTHGGELRPLVLASVERATGVSIATVTRALEGRGYAEVAVMITLPTRGFREWAEPATQGGVDMAFLALPETFTGQLTYAHELLHLVGADDLYRLEKIDPRDALDLMSSQACTVGSTTVGEATAYAIGWLPSAPPRVYAFQSPPG